MIDSEVVIDMVTFQSNTAALKGGGLSNYTRGLEINVWNSTFSGNSATSGGGISNGGEITVRKSLIATNTSTEGGAGIYNSDLPVPFPLKPIHSIAEISAAGPE